MSVVSGIVGAVMGSEAADTQAAATERASETAATSSERAAQIAAQAQRDAAEMQLTGQRESIAEMRAQLAKIETDLKPWTTAGTVAANKLIEMVQKGPGEYTESPGYQFRLGEGQKAIERAASSKGRVLSGPTNKALVKFGQDYATNDYTNWLNQWYQSLLPWQDISASGQNAAAKQASAGTSTASGIGAVQTGTAQNISNALMNSAALQGGYYTNAANSISNNIMAAAQARASGYINTANSVSNASSNALQGYMLYKVLAKDVPPKAAANYDYWMY